MSAALDLAALAGGHFGVIDVACPLCGPERRHAVNRRRKVLRIWRDSPDFATCHCARCGAHGFDRRAGESAAIDPGRLKQLRREAAARDADYAKEQRRKARWMWSKSRPAPGTIVETYLKSRGITLPVPATIRFLPPTKPGHHPTMISAYGIPDEPEPGVLAIVAEQITAVHLTMLKADGSGKADVDPNKITIASPSGMPMVLAPMNDLMGLAITEGIENALSVHQATGLGAWASGGAALMPKLAAAIENLATTREYDGSPDCITIFVDDDDDGRRNAHALATGLLNLSTKLAAPPKTEHFEVRLTGLSPWK
jgi:Toprim domain